MLFEVGPANGEPVAFYGTPLRSRRHRARPNWATTQRRPARSGRGAATGRRRCARRHRWRTSIPEAVAKAREQFVVKHPGQAADVAGWDDTTFLNKARVLKQGAVTNAAILLLGRAESATLLSPAVAKISWILKDAEQPRA